MLVAAGVAAGLYLLYLVRSVIGLLFISGVFVTPNGDRGVEILDVEFH